MSPPSQPADADPFADFLSATPSIPAVTAPAAAAPAAGPAGSELFGSSAASSAAQTQPSTKDAIMALYGSSTVAMPAGPYGMPSAGA